MLFKYLLKKWYLVAIYLGIVVLAPLLATKVSLMAGEILDYAIVSNQEKFFRTLVKFIIYFVVHGGLLFAISTIRTTIVSNCRRDIKNDMFKNIMTVDNAFFSKPDTGLHIAAFSNDITILETKYFDASLEFFESIITIIIAGTALVSLNATMAVIIVVGEVLCIAICYIVKDYAGNKNKIYIEKLAQFTQKVKDYFSAFQTIHNYSVEKQIKNRFSRFNSETETSKDDADMALAFINKLMLVCNTMIRFVIVGYGLALCMSGLTSVGLIISAYKVSGQFTDPISGLIAKINSIESVKSIAVRIKEIVTASQKETHQEDVVIDGPATIVLDKVSVCYDEKRVLNNVSYTFEPGKKYLIIGKNGAGKSTLLKLLKRSREDYEGTITINGNDLKSFSYKSLSCVVNYINESVPLICDTLRQNIALYRDVTDEKINEAVEAVGLKVELDRVIRDGERNLSSGETRRVEIARSLISTASVIVYDEAISTLDIPTAYEIEKTLLSLNDKTILFVSHNFSAQLLKEYDEIILLESGEICARGSHEELLASSEYYRHIMELKNG